MFQLYQVKFLTKYNNKLNIEHVKIIQLTHYQVNNKSLFCSPWAPRLKSLSKVFKFSIRSFSRQSTPKRVSFRKLIETGKAKTANYIPFKKYIQNYKQKKKVNSYSPISNGKMQTSSRLRVSLPGGTSGKILLKITKYELH
jgi:hypothetical protein